MAGRSREERFLARLAALGGRAGGGALRDALGWTEETFKTVKSILRERGDIIVSPGRGGVVALAEAHGRTSAAAPDPEPPSPPPAERRARPSARPAPAMEQLLWAAADKLRGNMDAAEYKHVALGLIFL